MNIPDCYDPIHQAEAREDAWSKTLATLPRCCICEREILGRYHEYLARTVCESCFSGLEDNVHMDVEF